MSPTVRFAPASPLWVEVGVGPDDPAALVSDAQLSAAEVTNVVFGYTPGQSPSWRAVRYMMALHRFLADLSSSADACYVWTGDRDLPPSVVEVYLLPAAGPRGETLAHLARADEPSAVGAVQVSEVVSDVLGDGVRCDRRDKMRAGLFRTREIADVRLAWRVHEETDVLVAFASAREDGGALVLPDVERLVRTARVLSPAQAAAEDVERAAAQLTSGDSVT